MEATVSPCSMHCCPMVRDSQALGLDLAGQRLKGWEVVFSQVSTVPPWATLGPLLEASSVLLGTLFADPH